jgi:hypothetical protein
LTGHGAESRLALVDGAVGIVFAPAGQLRIVLALTVSDARRITAVNVVAGPGPAAAAAAGDAAGLSRRPGQGVFPEVWEVPADR